MNRRHDDHARETGLADRLDDQAIYVPAIHRLLLLGAVVGGALGALLALLMASGTLAIAGLGQFTAAGLPAPLFFAASAGIALGGLAGGLAGVFRLPERRAPPKEDTQ